MFVTMAIALVVIVSPFVAMVKQNDFLLQEPASNGLFSCVSFVVYPSSSFIPLPVIHERELLLLCLFSYLYSPIESRFSSVSLHMSVCLVSTCLESVSFFSPNNIFFSFQTTLSFLDFLIYHKIATKSLSNDSGLITRWRCKLMTKSNNK